MKTQSITSFISDITREEQTIGNVFKRTILVNVHFDKEVLVPFDKQLVTRVFENLFNNALRYTRDNDTITLESYIDEAARAVIYKIQDTGIGIEEKDLKNIFDLFYRASDSRLEEGMGIGLSVVKNIIETHRWQISVDSKKNEGTCFTITIPFK